MFFRHLVVHINMLMRYTDILQEKKKKRKKLSPTYQYTGWGWYGYSDASGDSGGIGETANYSPTTDDITDVAEWFHTTPDNLIIDIVEEPISKFLPQIKDMYATYSKFPRDAARTRRIVCEIKKTNKLHPIYVEKDDPKLFVMEGRHRMVAFMLLEFKLIPVAYVSRKT